MTRFRMRARASFRTRHLRVSATVTLDAAVVDQPFEHPVDPARSVAAELGQYTTPAELLDLHAALDQYSDEETAAIRSVLAEQAWGRHRRRRAIGLLGPGVSRAPGPAG